MTSMAHIADQWIQGVCRRFSEAAGWPLRFAAAGSTRAELIGDEGSLESRPCWSAELHDGKQRVGFLYLDLPADQAADRGFLGVSELAETVARLTNRALVAEYELASRTRDVSTLADISRTLPGEDNLRSALNRLLRAGIELTGFRCAAFFLLNPKTHELHLRAEHHIAPCAIPFPVRQLKSSAVDLTALTEGKTLLRRETLDEHPPWLPPDYGTALCLAVNSDAGPLGTMWAFDRRRRPIPAREVHVLESIAAQVAATLERAVLLKESATQQRLRRELQVASEAQTFDVTSALPPHLKIDAAGICTSHYEVGGDLCELIAVGPQRLVVAVGDASGDSIPAALVMSAVRGALRSLAVSPYDELVQTDQIMARINQALYSITPSHQFMSLLFGVFDEAAGTFTYTNAGHPTPLHVSGDEFCWLESHGMLLGVVEDTAYEQSVLALSPGDLLVLYSDGISEAMCRRRTMFRCDGILTAVRQGPQRSAREVLDGILSNLELHTGGGGEGDDRTLLVLRLPR